MCGIQSPVEKEQICLFGHLLTQSKDKNGKRGNREEETKKEEKVGGLTVLDHPDREREREGRGWDTGRETGKWDI